MSRQKYKPKKTKGAKIAKKILKYGSIAGPGFIAADIYKKLNKKTKSGPKGRPGSQIHKATSVKRAKDKKPKTRTVTKRGQTNPKSKRI